MTMRGAVLVHLAAGIGNIVLATPLLTALSRMGAPVDLWLSADYPETAELFRGWAVVRNLVDGPEGDYAARIPAVPPFYWHRFSDRYDALAHVVARPPSGLFWTNEQAFYLAFARSLGYTGPAPRPSLPFCTANAEDGPATTVVLAPGCKTGDMAAKRWPYFVELAARFEQVTVVGTDEDLVRFDGSRMVFPLHARVLAGHAGLRATADAIASAAVVVANDSGLGHLAAALGVPTVLLFGPTPHRTLGAMPPNVAVLRAALPCEPCWFQWGRLQACQSRVDCLRMIDVERVAQTVRERLGARSVVAC